MSEDDEIHEIVQLTESFASRAHEELTERQKKWPTDLSESSVHEVVGALLARQVTLATQLTGHPQLWNGHIAPLILRAMADVYINMAWLLGSPVDRCNKFIDSVKKSCNLNTVGLRWPRAVQVRRNALVVMLLKTGSTRNAQFF